MKSCAADQGSFGDDQAATLRALGAGTVRLQLCNWPADRDALTAQVDAARRAGLGAGTFRAYR